MLLKVEISEKTGTKRLPDRPTIRGRITAATITKARTATAARISIVEGETPLRLHIVSHPIACSPASAGMASMHRFHVVLQPWKGSPGVVRSQRCRHPAPCHLDGRRLRST